MCADKIKKPRWGVSVHVLFYGGRLSKQDKNTEFADQCISRLVEL